MSFGTSTTWSRPKSSKQARVSDKWVDLERRDRTKPKGLKKVGKKAEFWSFVNHVLESFFVKIGVPRVCEIQSDFCDGYHIAKAHTRRRTIIRIGDWFHAFRVCWACQECHSWADQRERDESEAIIEAVIQSRFRALGLTEQAVKKLLLQCAEEVQMSDIDRYGHFVVEL
jgi:hypothetical protein